MCRERTGDHGVERADHRKGSTCREHVWSLNVEGLASSVTCHSEAMSSDDPVLRLSASEAAGVYSAVAGIDFEVVGRLAGGETGATEIRSEAGDRRVLKWESDPRNIRSRIEGAILADRLRTEANWPVPEQNVVQSGGWMFVAQHFMAGDPVTRLTDSVVEDLLTLHQARLGLGATGADSSW